MICECTPTQVRGANISAVEGGILQHVGTSSEGAASTSHVTIPGQVHT